MHSLTLIRVGFLGVRFAGGEGRGGGGKLPSFLSKTRTYTHICRLENNTF